MIRSFFREFRRKRAILSGIACPECQSAHVHPIPPRRKRRRCSDCGHVWEQPSNWADEILLR